MAMLNNQRVSMVYDTDNYSENYSMYSWLVMILNTTISMVPNKCKSPTKPWFLYIEGV
jgi:hypothetical protein